MGLYVTQRAGRAPLVWTPADQGSPNRADSKQELISFCPAPDPPVCQSPACENMRIVCPSAPSGFNRLWRWQTKIRCFRCNNLYYHHGLELAELIAIWEAQKRRCYHCHETLDSPCDSARRKGDRWGRNIVIDHDHKICPKANHSCGKCRRGLTCNSCNQQDLSARTRCLWVLPKDEKLSRWLEFLGPEDRDRLRKALAVFPEQPARQGSRRRSRETPGCLSVMPLFDLDADSECA